MNDWKSYINQNGDFELPNFLYRTVNDLMKQSLDMGTLLSEDQYKLRAYKEQTKKLFKNKWFDLAEALEYFGIIEKCVCSPVNNSGKEIYCDVCKGARYVINSALSPNEMREISMFVGAAQGIQVQEKLQKGLIKLLEEM